MRSRCLVLTFKSVCCHEQIDVWMHRLWIPPLRFRDHNHLPPALSERRGTGRTLRASVTENWPPSPSTYRFHDWVMTRHVMSSQPAPRGSISPNRTHTRPKPGRLGGPLSLQQSGLFAIRHASHVVRLLFVTPEHRLTCGETHRRVYGGSQTAACSCSPSPR